MVKGFKEMWHACPFKAEAEPLLDEIRRYNRDVLREANNSMSAAKGRLDLFTERYLQTVVEVGKMFIICSIISNVLAVLMLSIYLLIIYLYAYRSTHPFSSKTSPLIGLRILTIQPSIMIFLSIMQMHGGGGALC